MDNQAQAAEQAEALRSGKPLIDRGGDGVLTAERAQDKPAPLSLHEEIDMLAGIEPQRDYDHEKGLPLVAALLRKVAKFHDK